MDAKSKEITTTLTSWKRTLFSGVPLVVNSLSDLQTGDSVHIVIPTIRSKRAANITGATLVGNSEGFKNYHVDIRLASGQRYDHSTKDWIQMGIKNQIDFKDFFKCFGIMEFFVGTYDANAIRTVNGKPVKYTQENYLHVNASSQNWSVRDVISLEVIERKHMVFVRDAGTFASSTGRSLFPNDAGGGVFTMGGLYNQTRDVLFGRGSPTSEPTLRVMVRSLARATGAITPFPPVGSVEDKLLRIDKRLIMTKVCMIKTELLWEMSDKVGTNKEEIKMAIAEADFEELLCATCMHWRCQDLMLMMSICANKHVTKSALKPRFYLEFSERIMQYEGNSSRELTTVQLSNVLVMMSEIKDWFFYVQDWVSYVNLKNWVDRENIQICHLRFFVMNTSMIGEN